MMKYGKLLLWITCTAFLLAFPFLTTYAETDPATDLVILSTTDMHGKCWETNVLTGGKTEHNMLRVSTAVQKIRQTYGEENVILIDNGDLFQGTPISEIHLVQEDSPDKEPEAMALCLSEIGYDALTLGNHEFNYDWSIMHRVYNDLEQCGVSVLAANMCYDGTDGVHEAGDSVLGTYIIREVTINGNTHRVGILGLENNDITRWDLPVNYPGIRFAHPDNPSYDQAEEVSRFIPQMREDGCELIIVTYHGALGNTDLPLTFGINTENQGLRIIEETADIDLLILGHDHSASYSNTFITDKAGRQVPIVNGGGQDLTKTVFRLTEDLDGRLEYELLSTENISLTDYQPDAALEEKIRPYFELADAAMDQPVGTLIGRWDGSREFYTRQSDAMDLISAAMMETGTEQMIKKYGDSGLEALLTTTGLAHLDIDASFESVTNGGYIPVNGDITMRDIYRLYRYSNNILILPMCGQDIRNVLEENGAERLTCRILDGKAYFFTMNDLFTNIICGGINFYYDMSKPAGERVVIDSFASGRSFDPDALYLIAVNNYILGNERCGLRYYSDEDALWSQLEDGHGETIQDIIREYISQKTSDTGGVSTDAFNWNWSVIYSDDPASLPPYDGKTVAKRTDTPEDGHRYVLYHEAQACTLSGGVSNGSFDIAKIDAYGDVLVDAIPEDALIFTVHLLNNDTLSLTDSQGRYLACGSSGGLFLTETPADDLNLWQLIPAEGGYNLISVGAENDQALEYYNEHIMTYRHSTADLYLFNFYEVNEE